MSKPRQYRFIIRNLHVLVNKLRDGASSEDKGHPSFEYLRDLAVQYQKRQQRGPPDITEEAATSDRSGPGEELTNAALAENVYFVNQSDLLQAFHLHTQGR
jgi:hypothetical protein